jgi:hypothetical protein
MTKRRLICIITAILLFGIFILPFPFLNGKQVHLSLDDFHTAFIDLNKKKYSTIFDQPTFHYLHSIHNTTGAKFTLYTFSKTKNWNISEVPSQYLNELAKGSWIKIGFHSATPESSNNDSEELQKAFIDFKDAIPKNLQTHTLRLHYYHSTQKDAQFLASNGIKTLLAADDNRISYSLPISINDSLINQQRIQKDSIVYERTDIRVEKSFFPIFNVWQHLQDKMLVIFTHEWALNTWNALMFRVLIYYLAFYGCTFTTE